MYYLRFIQTEHFYQNGDEKTFTIMGFAWQDRFDMMNSSAFVIPVLLYKTPTDRISLDQFWPGGIQLP